MGPCRHRGVGRAFPKIRSTGLGEGIERNQDFRAPRLGKGNAFGQFLFGKIQTGKIPGVGFIAKAAINSVRASLDGGAQGCWRASRADEFHSCLFSSG